MENIVYFIIAIVAIIIIAKILVWPVKLLVKLLINSILGVILLVIVNAVGSEIFNFTIPINAVTSLIAGFAGIPGVIFLILFQLFF